jgi:hypothetical protein
MKDDLTVCVHESGHALMAFLWQCGPLGLEIFDDPGSNDPQGICLSLTGLDKDAINLGNPKHIQFLQKCILVGVAGPAAEFLYRGETMNGEDDVRYALEQLRFIQPQATVEKISPYLNVAIRSLAVPRNWGAVMKLAKALRKKRKLSEHEAKGILRNSRQPVKPPFPPVDVKLRESL